MYVDFESFILFLFVIRSKKSNRTKLVLKCNYGNNEATKVNFFYNDINYLSVTNIISNPFLSLTTLT